jgi:hypothetical protein
MKILLDGRNYCFEFKSYLKKQLNSYRKSNIQQAYMRNPKWPGSTLEEVKEKVKIFGEVDSRLSNIKVEKIYDNLYYLYK